MKKLLRIWENTKNGELSIEKENIDSIPTKLVFDSETKVIYYKLTEITTVYSSVCETQEPKDTKVGFMSPYISENGKYCRFIGNKIVEIR